MFRRLFVGLMFVTVFASQARADFIADLQGTTSSNSTFTPTGGSAINVGGLSVDLQAVFSGPPASTPATGVADYTPSSITAVIGGTTYVASTPGIGHVELHDLTSSDGRYELRIFCNSDLTIGAGYSTTTPSLSADTPIATTFSDYLGLAGNRETILVTSTGSLFFGFNSSDTVSASINAVPEPTSLVYFAEATLLGLGILVYRRRRVAGVVVPASC